MSVARAPLNLDCPAIARFNALARLDQDAEAAIEAACAQHRTVGPRVELLREGTQIEQPLLVLQGWAASARILRDGSRQLIRFYLPGELIGFYRSPDAAAVATVVTLTSVRYCVAPAIGSSAILDEAYALSERLDEAVLTAQIVRLGRMSAEDRIRDLYHELNSRLQLSGIAYADGFAMPLTQEMIADSTGLTAVHVNRMLRQFRMRGELEWRDGQVSFGRSK